jgi:hypothetical protein
MGANGSFPKCLFVNIPYILVRQGTVKTTIVGSNPCPLEGKWSKVEHLVEDIQTLLLDFSCWKVQAVGRDSNKVAHSIARMAISEMTNGTWRDIFPDCIHELVREESLRTPPI